MNTDFGPVLFSTPMVQAFFDDRKWMTRRVMNPQPPASASFLGLSDSMAITAVDRLGNEYPKDVDGLYATFQWDGIPEFPVYKIPHPVGKILWVREKWRTVDYDYCDRKWSASIQYADNEIGPRVFYYDNADVGIPYDNPYDKIGWRPSIFMPKEAARLFLRVTDVKVERVRDISPEDCVAEGAVKKPHYMRYGGEKCLALHSRYKKEFFELWDSLNAKRGFGVDANPWMVAYTLERVAKPEGWCK